MTTLDVMAAFDFLPREELVGTLAFDNVRGTVTYQFQYNDSWLKNYSSIVLCPELPLLSGWHYKTGHLFSLFQDVLPDRWGRVLLDKKERMAAQQEHRLPRTLSEANYLLQLDDQTRMGALRFRLNGEYVGIDDVDFPVPPITQLREFVDLAHRFERLEPADTIHEQWLRQLYKQGSSLGGARPKANVRDVDGTLMVAKIPSVNDDYDIALWEHFAHCLAKNAGIDVASTRLLRLEGQPYHTLLSRRFDRVGNQRLHFASAMTLCGLNDGANADSGNGYLDIVDMMVGQAGFADIHASLVELYRRVIFNCMIGNHDDHFRNHGFLLTSHGWKWSPAYDLNPSNMTTQSLLINSYTNESSVEQLLSSAEDYFLSDKEALSIIDEVKRAVTGWRQVATRCGISPSEQARFSTRLDAYH